MSVRLSAVTVAILAILPAASLPLAAADQPPKDLHLVGDHWTAWDPPTPPADVQVHVIVRGDTLWDLARQFYGDPYLWPQLWERNRYILDAHWIYPGDPLVLGIQVAPAENLAQGTEPAPAAPGEPAPAPAEPTTGVLSAGAAAGAPVPLGAESDIYCSGYVGDLHETFPYHVIGSEYDVLSPRLNAPPNAPTDGLYGPVGSVKYGLSTGDIIYLDGGRAQGMVPGAVFTALLPQQPVVHPIHRDLFGRYYRYLGRVRVLSVQEETAIAEIVHSCDPIVVGAVLKPFEPEPVPLGRSTAMRPINYPADAEDLAGAPTILMSRDTVVSLGEDHVVFIDRGADNDVTPGDIYTIYRMNRPGLPPVVLGELAVLSVHPRSSVARIIKSRYEVLAGDRLDPKE
jgi:LysM domain-containing protein